MATEEMNTGRVRQDLWPGGISSIPFRNGHQSNESTAGEHFVGVYFLHWHVEKSQDTERRA